MFQQWELKMMWSNPESIGTCSFTTKMPFNHWYKLFAFLCFNLSNLHKCFFSTSHEYLPLEIPWLLFKFHRMFPPRAAALLYFLMLAYDLRTILDETMWMNWMVADNHWVWSDFHHCHCKPAVLWCSTWKEQSKRLYCIHCSFSAKTVPGSRQHP